MREAARLQVEGAKGLLFVRYEELVAAPRRVLGEILGFCDLSADAIMLRYGERVLAPRAAYPRPDLNAAVAPLFAETMRAFGYMRDDLA